MIATLTYKVGSFVLIAGFAAHGLTVAAKETAAAAAPLTLECRKDGIDGTAHVLGDRGYFFVFNPWGQIHWGSITLDDTIGLQKSGNYAFSEISGEQPRRLGVCGKKGPSFFDTGEERHAD
jgi:hypothetical protein